MGFFYCLGKDDFKILVDICVFNFFKVVMDYKYKVMDYKKVMFLKDIYFVLDDEDIEKMYLESFKYVCKMIFRVVLDVENLKLLIGGLKKEEICCICMDELINLKLLKKCGYIFCI